MGNISKGGGRPPLLIVDGTASVRRRILSIGIYGQVFQPRIQFGHRLLAHKGDGRVLKRKVTPQRQRKHVMTFGDFHPDALEAVNRIFACAEPLISLEALNNNNADQNAVVVAASPSLTDSEIVEANEVFEDELDERGRFRWRE